MEEEDLKRGQNERRWHRQTAKLSVNRDTYIRTRASPDPSSDESVSTRLVLPNLLAEADGGLDHRYVGRC